MKKPDWRSIQYGVQVFLLILLVWRGILGLYLQLIRALNLINYWAIISIIILSILSTFGLFCWIVRSNRI